jgi:hypothetical protein
MQFDHCIGTRRAADHGTAESASASATDLVGEGAVESGFVNVDAPMLKLVDRGLCRVDDFEPGSSELRGCACFQRSEPFLRRANS